MDEHELSEALEGLIMKGLVEVAGVNADGELTYAIVGTHNDNPRDVSQMLHTENGDELE